MLVDYDIFRNVRMPDAADPQRLYRTADYALLQPGSVAVDAGVDLPSITDGFSGKAPDLEHMSQINHCRITDLVNSL